MTSLRENALRKVLSGVTTLQEINKVTFVESVGAHQQQIAMQIAAHVGS
jgi:hypothetical protein